MLIRTRQANRNQAQVVYVNIRWPRVKLEANPNRLRRALTAHGTDYGPVPPEA